MSRPQRQRTDWVAEWIEWERYERLRAADELRALADRVERGDVEWIADGREVARFDEPHVKVRRAAPPLRTAAKGRGWPTSWSPEKIRLMLGYEAEAIEERHLRTDLSALSERLLAKPAPVTVAVRRIQ